MTEIFRSQPGRVSIILVVLLAVSGIALAGSLVPARANSIDYTLYGDTGGWGFSSTSITSPGPDIVVKTGETVHLTLMGADNARHNFGVDYNGNGAPDANEPLSPEFSSDSTQQYSFTTTTIPGTYTYYCYFHGNHMSGRFIVSVNQLPTASFDFLPSAPVDLQTVLFNASPSRDPDGTIIEYAWDFGDGSTGTGQLVNHAFTRGTYTVSLTVTDNDEGTGSSQQTLTVSRWTSDVNNAPVADFTFIPGTPRAGELVTFDASGSQGNDPEDHISLYSWDFGDGQTNSTLSPKTFHRYTSDGTFTVVLNVTDSLAPQKTNQIQKTVTVVAAANGVDGPSSPNSFTPYLLYLVGGIGAGAVGFLTYLTVKARPSERKP